MERWTMETATAVTAAQDALPCQLCEWHVHSKRQHSKFKLKKNIPRPHGILQKLPKFMARDERETMRVGGQ